MIVNDMQMLSNVTSCIILVLHTNGSAAPVGKSIVKRVSRNSQGLRAWSLQIKVTNHGPRTANAQKVSESETESESEVRVGLAEGTKTDQEAL